MNKFKLWRISIPDSDEDIMENLQIKTSLFTKLISGYKGPSKKVIEKMKEKYPFTDTNIFFTKTNHIT